VSGRTVLVAAREPPHPPNAGDRIVTNGFARGLAARGHDLHLLAYAKDDFEAAGLSDIFESIETVQRPSADLPPRVRKLVRAAQGRSDVMEMFHSTTFRDALARTVERLSPDVVLAQHPYMGQFYLEEPVTTAVEVAGAEWITNAHVVEYAAHQRRERYADDLSTQVELTLEIPRLRERELAVYEASDCTLVLGEEDREELAGRISGTIVRQRVALPVTEYEPAVEAESEHDGQASAADGGLDKTRSSYPDRLLFFGSYNWFPNEDAVTYFCDEILPKLRSRHPDAEFAVAGRDAPETVRALADRPGVTFLGEVDDLAAHVRAAAIVVAPLRIGGGVRLKVLESMAWGAPVVTTPAGFEGVEATPGEDLLVEDGADALAEAIADLLGDAERRRRLGASARATIEETYAIDPVSRELERNLGIG